MLLQVLNEELYDVIQVSPKEEPVAAVKNMQKPQMNPELPPTRPPKSNRTGKASIVHKIEGYSKQFVALINISKLTIRTWLVL